MQGNLPRRASADCSWAFLLHQPREAHRFSAFPAIRFICTIAIQPARMCEKIPSSPKDALAHTVLSFKSKAGGKSPCSPIQRLLFRDLITAQVKSVNAYFWLGCFAHSGTAIAIRSCHPTFSCLAYSPYPAPRIVRAQKLQARYFTL